MKTLFKIFSLLLMGSTLFAASIQTNKTSYKKKESITVSLSSLETPHNCPDNIQDEPNNAENDCNWVGLFYAYDESKPLHLVQYRYAKGGLDQDITFSGLGHTDEYEARVFANNSYVEEDTISFKVTSQEQDLRLKTLKNSYAPGEAITVSASGLAGNSDDWLGIFYAYDDNEPQHVVYKIQTQGKKSGTFTFPALDEEFEYEVRAFFNGSYHEEIYFPFLVIDEAEENDIIINEVMAQNGHTILDPDYSKFSDWIELYNTSSKRVDISGYKLGTKIDEPSWTVPENTKIGAHGYLLLWADKKDKSKLNHHTNFKLKSKGGVVALFDKNSQLLDSLVYQEQASDISAVPAGANVAYANPTPLEANAASKAQLLRSDMPTASKNGGFSSSFSLTLSGNSKIYYTLNGDYPTKDSKLYRGAIMIDETTILKAIMIEEGKFASQPITHTYFINEESTLPVISITTDQKYLTDNMIGIYVEGKNGAYEKDCSSKKANYFQEWERPAFIEYYDKSKVLGFKQDVEIKLSGKCSRVLAQKSLSVKADDIFGKKNFEYQLFQEKNLQKFKSFKLRNSGQDWYKTMFRDAMIQQLIKDDLDIDYQAYQPTILFLNGKYWGIHNMREKKNGDYIENNNPDVDGDKVNILYAAKSKYTKQGTAKEYEELIQYLHDNDLSVAQAYNHVKSQIDIANYIDYQITQIYIGNSDWPNTNIRYWKETGKGKWRWMMDDQDYGFNLFDEDSRPDPDSFGLYHDTLSFATENHSDDYRNPSYSTFLLRSLFENDTFKNAFIARYNSLLNTTFKSSNVQALIYRMRDVIKPEMQKHVDKWGDYSGCNMEDWNSNIDTMIEFANKRPAIAKGHLDNKF